MSYKKVLDQNVLEIGPLDAINKSGSAIQKYVKYDPIEGAESDECVVDALPIIGAPYVDHYSNPDVSGQMMVYKIDTTMNSGIQEFIVHAKSYGDIFDRNEFQFTMGGNIIAIQATSDEVDVEEDWKWASDSAYVKQAIFKSSLSGAITVPAIIPVSEQAIYMQVVQGALGRINDAVPFDHPGLKMFEQGELLFNTISDGIVFPGIGSVTEGETEEDADTQNGSEDYIQFDLTFSFRFIGDVVVPEGEIVNAWQYIYRNDTGTYDQPQLNGDGLYEYANLDLLIPVDEEPIVITDKTITGNMRPLMNTYHVIDDNKRPTASMGYISQLSGDIASDCVVTDLPTIGDEWDDPTEYAPSATMKCSNIRRVGVGNERFKYDLDYVYDTYNIDPDEYTYNAGGEVISLSPTKGANGDPASDWLWTWETDDEPVFNSVFKAAAMGSISITKVVTALEYDAWVTDIKSDAGKINTNSYAGLVPGDESLPHPGLAGYEAGQLLFNSISGGSRTCNADGEEVYVFDLQFMFRVVGDDVEDDDWQYIYRKDTADWDRPINGSDYLYKYSEFGSI